MNIRKTPSIYKITNKVTGMFYVGSARRTGDRLRTHKALLVKRKHPNYKIQKDFNLHGWDSFSFEILELIEDVSIIFDKEQYYLDTLKPTYNIALSTKHFWAGSKHSEETKLKMSKARKTGRPTKREIRKSIGTQKKLLFGEFNPFYGKTHTEETKSKLSNFRKGTKVAEYHLVKWKHFGEENPFYGKKHSYESIEKMRNAKLGKKMPESYLEKRRGTKMSEETKRKMSVSQKNRPPRDEAFRLKMKELVTEYWRKKKQLKSI